MGYGQMTTSKIAKIADTVFVIHTNPDDPFSDEEIWLWIETMFQLPRDNLTMFKIFKLVQGAAHSVEAERTGRDNEELSRLREDMNKLRYELAMAIGGNYESLEGDQASA